VFHLPVPPFACRRFLEGFTKTGRLKTESERFAFAASLQYLKKSPSERQDAFDGARKTARTISVAFHFGRVARPDDFSTQNDRLVLSCEFVWIES
jgi:hypothetical protein